MKLSINDIFFTFQGEGYNAGRRALFVRMPFCNLSCSWCDTSFNSFNEWSKKDFKDFANREECRFAVITGGEPTMHKHTPEVISILHDLNYEIAMESNGCFAPPIGVDWLTISPKRDSQPPYFIHEKALESASELKYVVDSDFDFSILDRDYPTGQLYLSPEFNNFKENLNRIFSFIEKNPKWRISLQTHKWMDIK